MQFMKTHLISLICGVLGLVFIGGAVLGMMQDSVKVEMENRARIQGEISSLRSAPKNDKVIDAEKERGRLFDVEFNAALEEIRKINERKPLIEGVFPTTKSTTAAFDFKAAYEAAINELPRTMRAGDVPTPGEIAEEGVVVAALQKFEQEKEQEGGGAAPAISAQPTTPPPTAVISPMGNPRGGGAMMAGPGAFGMNVSPGTEPRFNPVFRAQVNKARSIRAYASKASFSVSPIIYAEKDISAEAMWYAQVALWVQQDVVKAIAATNEQAAQQHPEASEINVEHTPVKRLEKVVVQGYQTATGLLPFPATEVSSAAGQPGGGPTVSQVEAPRKSFLATTSNEEFDVVRFSLTLIMDQRDILLLIDALTKQNFCKCTYLAFSPAPPQEGYLYGSEPVVRVVLDFETYYARAFFAQWMPNDVKTKLGAQPQ
jgi:hypothetical protein